MTRRQPSYEELAANCARLEARVGESLTLQRDLNEARTRIDAELARFQAIQAFIEKSLTTQSDDEFYDIAMEAVIEAFEFEVALFLRPTETPGTLSVAGSFGIDAPPTDLPFDTELIRGKTVLVAAREDPVLENWSFPALHAAIMCPVHENNNQFTGLILGGLTVENQEFYEPVVADKSSAFTVMARQIGSVLNNRTLTNELISRNTQLEVEHARQIIMQRDLIHAKDQVDDELMRFRSIQEYIARTLQVESDDAFFGLTLEAIIEAFELETAMFLQVDEDTPGIMRMVSQFGFEDAPECLSYEAEWFARLESRIESGDSEILRCWSDLNLATSVICPFRDGDEKLGGIILAGVTTDSMDFYEQIRDEILVPFSVLVRQAGGLWINRQLNAEVVAQNRRLASLTKSYSRFVPFQFLDLLGRSRIEEIATGDSALRSMSVLFADIRGFTTLSEQLGPTEIFIALNEFLATMEPLITRNNGFINQYLGDAIMALFPESADAALRCAEAMLNAQIAFNRERKSIGKRPIHFGLGINSGPLMIGALGGGERLDSNVIGDTVNLASRAEGLTKIYGVPAIFTEDTHALLRAPETLTFREIDRVIVKGRKNQSTIYELMCPGSSEVRADGDLFATALRQYRGGDFKAAMIDFEACCSAAPDDPVPRLYIDRCKMFHRNPPQNWDGVWELDAK